VNHLDYSDNNPGDDSQKNQNYPVHVFSALII